MKPIRRFTRSLALVATTGLLGGLLALAPAAPAAACSMETVELVTFGFKEIKAEKKTYSRGQVALINVTVVRPANEDPLRLGLTFDPPATVPAADVNVGVGLSIGRTYHPGYSVTKDNGKATIRIRIPKWAPAPAVAHADASAWLTHADVPCARVEEVGYGSQSRLFKVKS